MNADAFESNMEDEAVESRIGDEKVAAAAEYKKRQAFFTRPRGCLGDVGFSLCLDVPARWAANAQSGEGRKLLVFFDAH